MSATVRSGRLSTRGGPNDGQAIPPAPGIDLIPRRPLIQRQVDTWIPLAPGDRPLVAVGDSLVPGKPLAERLRDAHLLEIAGTGGLRPGDRWRGEEVDPQRRRGHPPEGELLFESGGRWWVVAGEHSEPIDSPVSGIVREVRPGLGIGIRAGGASLEGALALGGVARGRLEIATGADGELLPRALDVGAAGSILVVGARIDAESLTRARAMGVRGVIVASLASKDRRDHLASESRQHAALHRLPSFAVLVLHGSVRRPISVPVMALLEALAGREVAIVGRPPALVFDAEGLQLATDAPDVVHVRSGPMAGKSGHWAGLAGLRRFAGATHLESGFVRFGDEPPVAVPLADLERLS
jgi:hypothetical protein